MEMIPIIKITEKSLAEVWERAIIALWFRGDDVNCQWQEQDTTSKDCLMIMRIEEPLSPPQIHKGMPCGLEELLMYVEEVVNGVHDHWINPEEKKWLYSYHDRLANYYIGQYEAVNQIETIYEKLKECPHSRRALGITWQPGLDSGAYDAPCLQNMQFRILDGKLHMTTHWRSNDAWTASFMNMYALICLQKTLAERLEVGVGSYTHIANSYHIYEKDFPAVEAFMETLQQRTLDQRTWNEESITDMMEDAHNRVQRALLAEKLTGRKGL